MNVNVRSFNRNFEKFRLLFRHQEDYPNVLILIETWYTSENVFGHQTLRID